MWAGGKSKFVKHYVPYLPLNITEYCEPFFGGGAMFLHIISQYAPKRIVINDVNAELMQIYRAIQTDCELFVREMDRLSAIYLPLLYDDRKRFYYSLRDEHAFRYQQWSATRQAATLYFLMKTSFNGIWQINGNTNGRYGTPCGLLNQTTEVYNKENVQEWHVALRSVVIRSEDWANVVQDDGSFIFCDPPYRGGFTKYGQIFGDDQQIALVEFGKHLRWSHIFITNRDIGDGFFELHRGPLHLERFNVTYTAGRRKRTDTGFEAKPAVEVLLHNTSRRCDASLFD
jgi:DNA adenine methylase